MLYILIGSLKKVRLDWNIKIRSINSRARINEKKTRFSILFRSNRFIRRNLRVFWNLFIYFLLLFIFNIKKKIMKKIHIEQLLAELSRFGLIYIK